MNLRSARLSGKKRTLSGTHNQLAVSNGFDVILLINIILMNFFEFLLKGCKFLLQIINFKLINIMVL